MTSLGRRAFPGRSFWWIALAGLPLAYCIATLLAVEEIAGLGGPLAAVAVVLPAGGWALARVRAVRERPAADRAYWVVTGLAASILMGGAMTAAVLALLDCSDGCS